MTFGSADLLSFSSGSILSVFRLDIKVPGFLNTSPHYYLPCDNTGLNLLSQTFPMHTPEAKAKNIRITRLRYLGKVWFFFGSDSPSIKCLTGDS